MSNSAQKSGRGTRILKITGMVLVGIAVAIAFALLFGFIVQYLWNWVMPDLFGLKVITYWQAFALVILAKIFFGSFGRHHKGRGHGGCGYGPWPGHRHGVFSRHDKKSFKRYWREEGKSAYEEYLKRVDSEKL
jgi:hypothetical protein